MMSAGQGVTVLSPVLQRWKEAAYSELGNFQFKATQDAMNDIVDMLTMGAHQDSEHVLPTVSQAQMASAMKLPGLQAAVNTCVLALDVTLAVMQHIWVPREHMALALRDFVKGWISIEPALTALLRRVAEVPQRLTEADVDQLKKQVRVLEEATLVYVLCARLCDRKLRLPSTQGHFTQTPIDLAGKTDALFQELVNHTAQLNQREFDAKMKGMGFGLASSVSSLFFGVLSYVTWGTRQSMYCMFPNTRPKADQLAKEFVADIEEAKAQIAARPAQNRQDQEYVDARIQALNEAWAQFKGPDYASTVTHYLDKACRGFAVVGNLVTADSNKAWWQRGVEVGGKYVLSRVVSGMNPMPGATNTMKYAGSAATGAIADATQSTGLVSTMLYNTDHADKAIKMALSDGTKEQQQVARMVWLYSTLPSMLPSLALNVALRWATYQSVPGAIFQVLFSTVFSSWLWHLRRLSAFPILGYLSCFGDLGFGLGYSVDREQPAPDPSSGNLKQLDQYGNDLSVSMWVHKVLKGGGGGEMAWLSPGEETAFTNAIADYMLNKAPTVTSMTGIEGNDRRFIEATKSVFKSTLDKARNDINAQPYGPDRDALEAVWQRHNQTFNELSAHAVSDASLGQVVDTAGILPATALRGAGAVLGQVQDAATSSYARNLVKATAVVTAFAVAVSVLAGAGPAAGAAAVGSSLLTTGGKLLGVGKWVAGTTAAQAAIAYAKEKAMGTAAQGLGTAAATAAAGVYNVVDAGGATTLQDAVGINTAPAGPATPAESLGLFANKGRCTTLRGYMGGVVRILGGWSRSYLSFLWEKMGPVFGAIKQFVGWVGGPIARWFDLDYDGFMQRVSAYFTSLTGAASGTTYDPKMPGWARVLWANDLLWIGASIGVTGAMIWAMYHIVPKLWSYVKRMFRYVAGIKEAEDFYAANDPWNDPAMRQRTVAAMQEQLMPMRNAFKALARHDIPIFMQDARTLNQTVELGINLLEAQGVAPSDPAMVEFRRLRTQLRGEMARNGEIAPTTHAVLSQPQSQPATKSAAVAAATAAVPASANAQLEEANRQRELHDYVNRLGTADRTAAQQAMAATPPLIAALVDTNRLVNAAGKLVNVRGQQIHAANERIKTDDELAKDAADDAANAAVFRAAIQALHPTRQSQAMHPAQQIAADPKKLYQVATQLKAVLRHFDPRATVVPGNRVLVVSLLLYHIMRRLHDHNKLITPQDASDIASRDKTDTSAPTAWGLGMALATVADAASLGLPSSVQPSKPWAEPGLAAAVLAAARNVVPSATREVAPSATHDRYKTCQFCPYPKVRLTLGQTKTGRPKWTGRCPRCNNMNHR
jgi:hypothetical protein